MRGDIIQDKRHQSRRLTTMTITTTTMLHGHRRGRAMVRTIFKFYDATMVWLAGNFTISRITDQSLRCDRFG